MWAANPTPLPNNAVAIATHRLRHIANYNIFRLVACVTETELSCLQDIFNWKFVLFVGDERDNVAPITVKKTYGAVSLAICSKVRRPWRIWYSQQVHIYVHIDVHHRGWDSTAYAWSYDLILDGGSTARRWWKNWLQLESVESDERLTEGQQSYETIRRLKTCHGRLQMPVIWSRGWFCQIYFPVHRT